MDENAEHQKESFETQLPEEAKKKKTGKSGVSKYAPAIIWLTMIFFVGMVLGNMLWLFTADVLAFGREDRPVEFSVSSSDTLKDISKNMAQQGLIEFPGLFRLYARFSGTADRIQPGIYALNTKYDYPALAKVLSSGTVQREAFAVSPLFQGET